ncbi:MAG: terpene cyclase/mutase family protein [Phycisphaerae bacterium]|nr:terpene cyclase/mutase family protein [Phycisphaerae bacterium]
MRPNRAIDTRWAARRAAAVAACGVLLGCGVVGVVCGEAAGQDISDLPDSLLPEMMDRETVKAIDAGMKYLARVQHRSGQWLSNGRYGSYPGAMTALGGLAMMAGGSTPAEGPYAKEVRRAMRFLLNASQEYKDGMVIGSSGGSRSMYGHGFSMLFLAQCYGMQADEDTSERLSEALTQGAKLTASAQSDLGEKHGHAGGWYYTPGSNNDEGSVTVTQLQALRACRNAGIKVNKDTIARAVRYLKHCQQADGGICYSASNRGSSRPAISAAAVACFYAAGVYDRKAGGSGEEAKMVERLVNYCKGRMDVARRMGHWFYAHYYYAQAMYQRGGADWKAYYPAIRDKLLSMQAPDGSWNGDGTGTVYGTAMALTILQLPYGYLPIYER